MREVRNRYEIFLKVCETGNFTKAAEALNYTQSGISQMMAGLEEELGVQLFARAKKVGVLTDNGQRLIPYIREMVNQKEKLRQAAGSDTVTEIELVGLCTGICVLSNAILCKAAFPEADVSVDAACCACVTPASHDTALVAMELCQIEVRNKGGEPWRK